MEKELTQWENQSWKLVLLFLNKVVLKYTTLCETCCLLDAAPSSSTWRGGQ